MKSDEELAQGILAKDRTSFYLFYKRYKPRLLAFLRKKVSKEEDCEEILQDTFFAFLEALRDFHGKSSIKTYMYSICHHKIIDYYRRKKIKQVVFSQYPQLELLVSPLLTPEDAFDEEEVKKHIARALERILPRYKEVLVCKYVEDMSVSDIAHKLSLSFKSVESRLFRARKAFVEAYGQG